jgi:Flp pilus assembly protein TadG
MRYKLIRDERGAIAVMSAFVLVLMIGFAALAVEFGHGLLRHMENQRIADIAAYSGALVYSSTDSADSTSSAVADILQLNGLSGSDASTSVVSSPSGDGNKAVQVMVTTSDPLLLARVLTTNAALSVSATGIAEVGGGGGCILALNPTAADAVTMNGSANVDADCGVAINSSNSQAFLMNGTNSLTASSLHIVGNMLRNPTSSNTLSIPKIQTGAAATADPWASAQVPSFTTSPCLGNQTFNGSGTFTLSGTCWGSVTINGTGLNVTLNPGVYNGTITINGSPNVTLNPGTYIINKGSFTINGGGSPTVTGNGVAIVLTSSTGSGIGSFTDNGNPVLNLTAESSGFSGSYPMPGFIVFQDRRASAGGSNVFNGAPGSKIEGALYFPTQNLTYNGQPATGPGCTEIVAQEITFNGSPSLFDDTCTTQFGLSPISGGVTKLVQ